MFPKLTIETIDLVNNQTMIKIEKEEVMIIFKRTENRTYHYKITYSL